MPQSPTDLPRKLSTTVCVCARACVCLSVLFKHACKGGGCWKLALRILISPTSSLFTFSGPLRKPHLSIHPSILTQLKQCCLFAVSLSWFPLCFLPALVWRTKRWWWVVCRDGGKEKEAKQWKKIYVYMIYFFFFVTGCLISSLTQTHGYSVVFDLHPQGVQRR